MSVPKPEPGSADVVRDEQVRPLAAQLLGRPLERARLRGEPDDDRPRVEVAGPRRPTSARMSSVGSSWSVRPSPRASFVRGGGHGPEVGDGGGHHEGIGAAVDDRRQDGVAHLGRSLGADDGRGLGQRHVDAARDDRHPCPAREGRLRDRDAHPAGAPVADEPDGVDRFRRAAGADDDVTPGEVGLADVGDDRRPRGGVRLADRPAADGRDHRIDDPRQLREPAHALLARREAAGFGRDHRVAEVALEPLDVVPGRAVRPHVAVHRRREHDRRRGREAGGRDRVVRDPVRHRAQPAGGRGGHDDRVGGVGDHDVPDPLVGEEPQHVRLDRVPRQRRNVSGPTNVAADGVSITTTSAPSARSSRTSSTALYAAIEPHTPRPMSRPSSRPVTRRPGRERLAAGRPRRGGSRGP